MDEIESDGAEFCDKCGRKIHDGELCYEMKNGDTRCQWCAFGTDADEFQGQDMEKEVQHD